jgi:hypothetical protein
MHTPFGIAGSPCTDLQDLGGADCDVLTFIITLSIPLSLLAAFIGLLNTGNTLKAMTLGGNCPLRSIDPEWRPLGNHRRASRAQSRTFSAGSDGSFGSTSQHAIEQMRLSKLTIDTISNN